MGRRVLANGKAVATTTSAHVARAIAPDMRLMGQVPVPRKNWIDSEHLAANRTTNTKFDDGWVWKQNTKCGEPPFSKAMPDDHLPGIVNGGFVDGCAEAMEGQGAPTVYVEGLKAICKDHITWQNHRNTIGMIVNAEDLAAYLAEPMPPSGEEEEADAVATRKKDTGGGDEGGDEDAREKNDDGNTTTTKPDATPACTLTSFEMIDDGKRKSSDKHVLEVIAKSKVQLVAKGGFCGDHPLFSYGTTKAKGPEAALTTTDDGVAQVALLHKWWKEMRVVCDAHGKQITGTIAICSSMKWELEIGEDADKSSMAREQARNRLSRKVLNLRSKLKPYFKALEKKLPFKVPFADFKYLEGSVSIEAAWKEQKDWQTWCEYSASGKMMILDAFLKWEVELDSWLIKAAGPAAPAIELLIYILEWVLDKDLSFVKLEIKFGGKLEAEAKGTLVVDRFSKVKEGGIELTGSCEVYLSVTLKLDLFGAVEGSMGGKGSFALELTGTIKVYPAGALGLGCGFKGFSLSFTAGLKIKLGWLGRFVPDWLTVKAKSLLGADISADKKSISIGRTWKLVDGWGKFDVFKTEFNLP